MCRTAIPSWRHLVCNYIQATNELRLRQTGRDGNGLVVANGKEEDKASIQTAWLTSMWTAYNVRLTTCRRRTDEHTIVYYDVCSSHADEHKGWCDWENGDSVNKSYVPDRKQIQLVWRHLASTLSLSSCARGEIFPLCSSVPLSPSYWSSRTISEIVQHNTSRSFSRLWDCLDRYMDTLAVSVRFCVVEVFQFLSRCIV